LRAEGENLWRPTHPFTYGGSSEGRRTTKRGFWGVLAKGGRVALVGGERIAESGRGCATGAQSVVSRQEEGRLRLHAWSSLTAGRQSLREGLQTALASRDTGMQE
jgi:hypothetical protein